MRPTTARRLALLICLGLVLAFLAQGWACVRDKSPAFDEASHITAGYSFLTQRDFRLYIEHPPLIREWCALPVHLIYRLPFAPDAEQWQQRQMWAISREWLYNSAIPADQILTAARLPNLLLGAGVVGLVGWWSYRLWGARSAVVGTALAAFEPNLVAHSSLVGTDTGITLFTLLALYLLWTYGQSRSFWRLALTGLVTGLALTAKFSAVLLLPILGAVLTVQAGSLKRLPLAARDALVIAVAAALVFLPVYLMRSPLTWLEGFVYQARKLSEGHPAFFLGEHSDQGWWSYHPVAFAIKTPLGSLALILASLVFLRAGHRLGKREALVLLLPVVVFAAAALRSKVDVGVRYLLPVYPFLFVLASRLATIEGRRPWLSTAVVGLPLLLTAASVLRVAPHHLAYFNEAVGGPERGWHYLGDSNIDWGQDLKGVRTYMDREGVPMIYLSYFGSVPPEGYGIRYQEAPTAPVFWPTKPTEILPPDADRELLVISVTNLQGIYFRDKDIYAWLYDRRPVATIGYSMYVYDLTGDAAAHRHLAETYRKVGKEELTEAELRKVARRKPAGD